MTRKLVFAISLMIVVVGMLGVASDLHVGYASPYTDVDVDTAYNMITNGSYPDLVVLDVRTQSEYDSGHIYGAVWIPHTELEARISELADYEDHETIVYCLSGGRSATASGILDSNNFTKVYNMLGGFLVWQSSGYQVWIATVHNLNTTINYDTIQAAIDAPETLDGHTILVNAGTYYEHVTITKSIFLLGENRNTTVIDGNGTGTVVQISTDNITVANFATRNGGHGWPWLDSCIYGNYHSNIKIENNTVTNATNGIIFYGFFNSTMRHNFAEGLGLMGLHLDGDSTNCTIEENTVINCLEGIEIERSAGNLVEGNRLICNNASIVLNSCSGSNVLRKNNMTSDWYNLIVWGFSLEAFMQDIDTSNTLNNKTVYYITNSNNLIVDSSGYPDLGYLAVVNCTNLTIKDTDLSYNTDGLLVAQSTNCCLANITIGENRGPLLHGGLTFFRSINNSVVNSRIVNNSVGVCLCQSNNNHFYHNAFVDNDKPVISNFHSPFSPPSGSHSIAKWDNGFEGNYWSNYTGVDLDHDGIGDSEHVLDANNQDNHPLMGMFSSFNTTLRKYVNVISNSTIEDFEYFESNSTIKMHISNMTANQTYGFCRVCIPHTIMDVNNISVIIGDGLTPVLHHNYTLHDNGTHRWIYFAYEHSTLEIVVIPEFPSVLILPLFMIATLLAVIVYRRKHQTRNKKREV